MLFAIISLALCISVIINYYSFKFVFETLEAIDERLDLVKQVSEITVAKVKKLEEKVKNEDE
jgi:hypothetical protein